MRLEQLKYLADIAQTGSITCTAERLFLTQQAVSKNIRQLEQEYEIDILRRTNTGVEFTEAGKEIVTFAQNVLEADRVLRQQIQQQKEKKEEAPMKLHICSTSSVTNIALPKIISCLDAQQQKLDIRISMTDTLEDVFSQVAEGKSDLGLLTFNAQELKKKHASYQDEIQLEVLALDEMIAVMDRRYYSGDKEYLSIEEYHSHISTLYNIIPIEMYHDTETTKIVCPNNADFHRNMMETAGAIVVMPGLAYQYFFNSKKYVGLPLEGYHIDMAHAAIYRRDAGEKLQYFVSLIRKEMYMQ